jgi:IrrE N-terminal-like domain
VFCAVKLTAVKEKARKLAVEKHGLVRVPRHDSKAGVWVSSPDVRDAVRNMGIRWSVVVSFRDLTDQNAAGIHDFQGGAHRIYLDEWSHVDQARRAIAHELVHALQQERTGGRSAFKRAYRADRRGHEEEALDATDGLCRKFPGVVYTR